MAWTHSLGVHVVLIAPLSAISIRSGRLAESVDRRMFAAEVAALEPAPPRFFEPRLIDAAPPGDGSGGMQEGIPDDAAPIGARSAVQVLVVAPGTDATGFVLPRRPRMLATARALADRGIHGPS